MSEPVRSCQGYPRVHLWDHHSECWTRIKQSGFTSLIVKIRIGELQVHCPELQVHFPKGRAGYKCEFISSSDNDIKQGTPNPVWWPDAASTEPLSGLQQASDPLQASGPPEGLKLSEDQRGHCSPWDMLRVFPVMYWFWVIYSCIYKMLVGWGCIWVCFTYVVLVLGEILELRAHSFICSISNVFI